MDTNFLHTLACAQLPSAGINQQFISFTNVTMESEKFICVRETSPQNSVVIVDMSNPMSPARRQITADSAIMNPVQKVIALKAKVPNTTQDSLQIFDLERKEKLKSFTMPEEVVFWKWITDSKIGLITAATVYHWDMLVGITKPLHIAAARVGVSSSCFGSACRVMAIPQKCLTAQQT